MEFYIVRNSDDRKRVHEAIDVHPDKRPFSVEIKEYRKKRSLSQNRLMWMWIGQIADHTGDDPDDIHWMLKSRILGTVRKEIIGDPYEIAKSTAELTSAEFSEYLSRIEEIAKLLQIRLTKPDDFNYARYGDDE